MFSQIDRQLFARWRKDAFGRSRAATRVAVVGNCQSFGYSYGMKLFNPGLEIDRYALVGRSLATLDMLAKALKEYDIVFAQDFGPALLRDNGDSETLRKALPSIHRLPFVNFFGFHPDTVYLFDPTRNGKLIMSPTGVYNSGLTLYGYLKGMSVDQTEALFNHDVFDYVGYLGVWNGAAEELLRAGSDVGMDLHNELARWARRGNFMYTPNHSKPHVMYDVALKAMKKAGLPARDIDPDDYLVDDLVRGFILPVYPPLADLYGIRGSTLFKKEHYRLSLKPGEFLTLRDYIAESFAIYARHEKPQLANARVDGWLADEETQRTLAVLSAETMKRKALGG
ncbi:MAG: WcbI family polysaccharide biosynthesis putative acetyltransferase [Beijerinckiaceae bacterium]